jgi:tRNA G18 (ribose-2'-O)-methylase SpoU
MKTLKITTRNAAFQIFAALKKDRGKRKQRARIIVEGVIPVTLCVQQHVPVEAILVEEGQPLSTWARDILAAVACPYLYQVATPLMAELSDKAERSELLLVAEYPSPDLDALQRDQLRRVVVLDRPSNPGNLGAIVRTCDAFRIDAVFLAGHGVDPYDPKTITASRGTVFAVPVIPIESNARLQELIGQLRDAHPTLRVYGSSGTQGTDLSEIALAPEFCLIIGNEAQGMSDFVQGLADDVVKIGMHGAASSLNAACAASILLYELTRECSRNRPAADSPLLVR